MNELKESKINLVEAPDDLDESARRLAVELLPPNPKTKAEKAASIKALEQKSKRADKPSTVKKLDLDSAKLLEQLSERANKKNHGRKVRDSEILNCALKFVTNEHLERLKEQTLSEQDRLKIAHETYNRTNSKITYDQFLGKLLRGELNKLRSESNPQPDEN